MTLDFTNIHVNIMPYEDTPTPYFLKFPINNNKNMAVARDFTAECTPATLVLGSGMMCDDRFWKNG